MAEYTQNLNLEKPAENENFRRQVLNDNMDKIDTAVKGLRDRLDNGVKVTQPLTWGMNHIRNEGETPVFPEIKVKGRHYVNLLGKDGNCEDLSKFGASNCSVTLDSTNKCFGSYCIKVGITSGTQGYAYPTVIPVVQNKYYFLSAYMRNGNASRLEININGYGGVSTTDSTSMKRYGAKVQYTGSTGNGSFNLIVNGSSGQYGFFDGAMMVEITAEEYNTLSADQLLAKYPYIDSAQGLKNLYLENRRYNLLLNGNTEKGIENWIVLTGCTLKVVDNRFLLTSPAGAGNAYQKVKVKPNTNYFINSIRNDGTATTNLIVMDSGLVSALKYGNGTFNTGSNTDVVVMMYLNNTGNAYFSELMLVEGTTAPTEYKSCAIERFVLNTELWDGDVIEIKDGKVDGLLNWKHRNLYGKDYDWQYQGAGTGWKAIQIPSGFYGGAIDSQRAIKYNGIPLTFLYYGGGYPAGDYNSYSGSSFYLSVAHTDSGWIDSVHPSNDEIKTLMNGWKALAVPNTRYVCWASIIDGSIPAGAIFTQVTSGYNVGASSITVGDTSKFANGDNVYFYNPITKTGTGVYSISISSGTVLGVSPALSNSITTSHYMIKCDIAGIKTDLVNWCKNNVAPNYAGYQLHYKLATPEPVTDINVPMHGDLWSLVQGNNYVTVDSGVVLGEVANPGLNVDYYVINKTDVVAGGLLGNKCNMIIDVFRNSINDTHEWSKSSNQYAFGLEYAYIDKSKFDINASYTVDYRRLYEEAPQIAGELYLKFKQDIVSSVECVAKAVDCRQKADSALDRIADLSLYEEFEPIAYEVPFISALWAYIDIVITFKVKKVTIPIIKRPSISIQTGSNGSSYIDVTDKFINYAYAVTKDFVKIAFYTNDATTIANMNSYGVRVALGATTKGYADCRGRI